MGSEMCIRDRPVPEEKRIEKMKILSVAPLFAEAMTRVFTNGSISKLFD